METLNKNIDSLKKAFTRYKSFYHTLELVIWITKMVVKYQTTSMPCVDP